MLHVVLGVSHTIMPRFMSELCLSSSLLESYEQDFNSDSPGLQQLVTLD